MKFFLLMLAVFYSTRAHSDGPYSTVLLAEEVGQGDTIRWKREALPNAEAASVLYDGNPQTAHYGPPQVYSKQQPWWTKATNFGGLGRKKREAMPSGFAFAGPEAEHSVLYDSNPQTNHGPYKIYLKQIPWYRRARNLGGFGRKKREAMPSGFAFASAEAEHSVLYDSNPQTKHGANQAYPKQRPFWMRARNFGGRRKK